MEKDVDVTKQHSYSRKKVNLIGQRFGKLTVIGPAENIGSRTAWLCQCDCGNKVIKKTVHLRSGHVTTCGCEGIANRLTMVDGTCLEMLQSKTLRKQYTMTHLLKNLKGVSVVEVSLVDHEIFLVLDLKKNNLLAKRPKGRDAKPRG